MSKQPVLNCLTIVSFLLVAVACAGPPTEAMTAAEQAISDAVEAEVDKYAPAEYEAATAELEKARAHMAAEEYGDAKTAAENTMALVESASQESVVQKELVKREAMETLRAFADRMIGISNTVENASGRTARELAQEISEFKGVIEPQVNELVSSEKWHDLKTVLEEANMLADSFEERAGG